MKKNLFCLFVFICPFMANAQVKFNTFASFDALLEQAKTEKKLIFIQLESDKCPHCNDVAMAGLSEKILKEKYATNFVSTKAKVGDSLHLVMVKKYRIRETMGSFYLDTEGNVLYKNGNTTSSAISYSEWAVKSIENAAKTADFMVLEQTYKSGNRTPDFLEKYITTLRGLDREADGIMNEYIGKMTVDSLASDRVIQFVFEEGMSLNAPAYKAICTLNSKRKIDSVWCAMPESKRNKIANKTINQTFRDAIRGKNRSLMFQLDSYTRNSYGKNYRKGQIEADLQFINYYRAIKDSATFFRHSNYVAQTVLFHAMDSLKKWESIDREEAFGKNFDMMEKRMFTPGQYPNLLNTLAWYYYEATDKPEYLEKALIWSQRSMDIFKELKSMGKTENPAYLDTYAHVLYKLKRFDEAVEWQTKAIEAQKMTNIKSDGYELERDKMINRKL
jgi:hypothetical protein